MESETSKIPFIEIKTYEQAYYYNSDPSDRMNYNKYKVKPEKNKKFKMSKTLGEVIGTSVEGVLEILFSFLD
ncbi:hypothetical protein [Clostridium tertium]|uniref:Uncharacterized protein n=1 Tax=Clostridium tertium TaxID=1559 RepID=A0A6N3B7E0_9CLOT